MSHFTVMVIGEDIEAALQPFHEFECTGIDDQYVKIVDKLPEAIGEYHSEERKETLAQFIEDWYGAEMIGPMDNADRDGKHKYGWCRADTDGHVIEFVKRTNKNAKWDWWTVGGRWSNFLILKNGRCADSATKCEIDFERIRNTKAHEADNRYDDFDRATDGLPVHTAWPVILEKHGHSRLNDARDEYHDQPAIKALRGSESTMWFDPDDFLIGREQYVERARQEALLTHAILHEGVWRERGRMGWFACVSGEKKSEDWLAEFNGILDSLPDDARITIVDCHI